MLNSAGIQAINSGPLVSVENSQLLFEIVNECSSLVMISILASLLLATSWLNDKQKIVGFAFGALFLFVFNLFRLAGTIAVGARYGQSALDVVHIALWLFDSLLVVVIWAKISGLLDSNKELVPLKFAKKPRG